MAVRWLSINDIRRLAKENMLSIRNGEVFDRRQGNRIGRISGNSFQPERGCGIPPYIEEWLDSFPEDNWDADYSW